MEDLKLLRTRTGQYYGDFNDIQFDEKNDLDLISGSARTRQNIVKILLTIRGTNKKYPHYGTYMQKIGNISNDYSQKQLLIRESIIQALKYLQIVEESEEENELLESIQSIDFCPSEDSREYRININIVLESGDLIKIELEENENA